MLFGRVNPSGRLAETIPLKLADHPSYLDFPGENGHVRYGEGIHVGYRGFDAREQEVAYPFGFGLSYTTFEYGQASAAVTIAGIELRVPVTNAGQPDGREVVQVYVSLPGSAVRRAPRELKAFANVAIAAGQTADVVLTIDRDDLAYWETRLGRWVVEGGEYHCAVGASSRDLRTTAVVKVPGDDARVPLTAESTVAEWLADPRGAELLARRSRRRRRRRSRAVAGMLADPGLGVHRQLPAQPDGRVPRQPVPPRSGQAARRRQRLTPTSASPTRPGSAAADGQRRRLRLVSTRGPRPSPR